MAANMDEELRRKYTHVCAWLNELYVDEAIPSFEVNEYTVNHLYNLSLHNKKMDKLSALLLQDINTKCEEYQADNERMKEILNAIGLSASTLSNDGER